MATAPRSGLAGLLRSWVSVLAPAAPENTPLTRESAQRLVQGYLGEEGTDSGGGTVDYEPENRSLFLSRTYTQVPDERAFGKDLKKLMKASLVWGREVLDRVASRVFHPEELEKR